MYADFESFIKPINTCQPDPCKSYTKNINTMSHHRSGTASNALMMKFAARKLVMYTAQSEDDDVAQKFIDMLEEDINQIYEEQGDEVHKK